MKKFNVTGLCIPERNYMVDTSKKIDEVILKYIDEGEYFTINRPRQYGKTTTMYLLNKKISKEGYLVISISFEGIGESSFENEKELSKTVLELMADILEYKEKELSDFLNKELKKVDNLKSLSKLISKFIIKAEKKVVLMIDEVDKSSNNKLFLNFIGMLREKYLRRNAGEDYTFHSVILAGVHDIKNLKLRYRKDEERIYNSPWNIAADFDIDMSFSSEEISSMLIDYEKDNKTGMDIEKMSDLLRDFTSGYPFLVSKLCKIIDEKLNKEFTEEGLRKAINKLLNEKNTLFDDVIKNIENNRELYELIRVLMLKGEQVPYFSTNKVIDIGLMYGILIEKQGKVVISNKIFEVLLYNHMIGDMIVNRHIKTTPNRNQFIKENNILDMEKILEKFQLFMKSEYRDKDEKFIEREGRLLFLSFLKPIINGEGFYFVEPETRQDNRMDIVVVYNKIKYIIELKIWHGEEMKKQGIKQLCGYLEGQGEDKGYLVIFNFNKGKKYEKKMVEIDGKILFEVVV
ncbi:AAA-like domain-containing protein [Haliovirga abyssi]|uniref:AAA family ATPase n=1 Tax=Haliovirga abyssi TaxID=2996794 RepID=A0AAU9D573_9FUSO|nr:AAA-like domain-containing protein [Haliovirga abyssi]BDU51124.1 hypothetical protein HLVA_16930 [Haliovirga abyssi]